MMPIALLRRAAFPTLVLTAATLMVTSCTSDQSTEPRNDSGPELATAGCPGVCLRDNFTGFGGTLLENHTPDGEGDPFQWLRGGDPSLNSFAQIQDNAVEPADDAFPRYDYFADAGAGLDVVEADIIVVQPVTNQQEVLFYLRATPERGFIGDGWALRLIIFGPGNTEIDLYKAGSTATFVQTSDPWSPGTYHVRFEIIGDQVLKFYIDGVLRLSYTDGDEPLGQGTVGIGGFRAGPAQVRITSFAAGEIEQQSVNVLCSPSNPVRGVSIRCKTALAVPERYTVVRRTAQGTGFLVEDLTTSTHEPGDTNTWEGIAVAPSDVTVEVQVGTGGTTQNLTNQTPATFGVQGRPWPTWVLTTLFPPTRVVIPAQNMTEYPIDGTALGQFQADYPDVGPLALSRPVGGPNRGLVYLRDPLLVTGYLVNTHPALYPPTQTTPMGSKKWYKDQNGKGSGNCSTAAQIATLAANVERHEGITKATNSHFGVANQQFALLQPQKALEELYSPAGDAAFRAQVDAALLNFNNTGPYAAAQTNFDAQDTQPVLNSAGCQFDFNPNDN